MKKINFIGILLIVFILPIANAQQPTEDPGVTPDSFLWGLDKALDNLNLLLTFDKGGKAKKGIEIARERLLEVKSMVEENKLEAAEKAKEEHGKNLLKVKQNIKEIEEDDSKKEIKEVIEIEKELEELNEEVEDVNTGLKIKIKIEGTLTEEQKALINSLLDSLEGQTGEVEIEIKNKKDKTKIKIKQETGKSDEEIEDEIEEIEEEQGLADIKKEKAAEEIEDVKEDLNELEEELQEHKSEGHVADETPITNLIYNAKKKLSNAEEAFSKNDFGEAFGQANAAKQLIENAERILEKTVEKFEEEEEEHEEEEQEIKVEIKEEEAKVKIEIGDEKLKFTLETTDKNTIIQEIAARTGLSIDQVTKLAKIEEEKQEETEEELEIEDKWGCGPVTQGIAPDPNNPAPTVCGYIPVCPREQNLIVSLGQGTWPDGSLKGVFSCSSELPP